MSAAWEQHDTFTPPDGARLSIRREPARGSARGSLVLVHGWGDYTGRWGEQAGWLAERGIHVIGIDQRGHGLTPGTRGHVDRFAQYLSDLAAVRKLAESEAPGPQFLMGHSFGGFIVLRYLETAPRRVAGAIALTPYVDLYQPPARWKVVMANAIVDLLPRLPIPTGLAYDEISRDKAVVDRFHHDPHCHQKMTPRAYTEAMANLAVLQAERERIHTPLFVALAGEDHIVSTTAAADFAHGVAGDVTVKTFAGMYHNILHEPDRERVYAELGPWVERLLEQKAAA
jgi:alpha-beta hydrolase superfamily lysophospholipase